MDRRLFRLGDARRRPAHRHIDRSKKLYRSAKPWSAGKLVTSGWKHDGRTKDFFASYAGDSCAAYGPGTRSTYAVDWLASAVSPPDLLPSFLGLEVLQPVTAASLAARRDLVEPMRIELTTS